MDRAGSPARQRDRELTRMTCKRRQIARLATHLHVIRHPDWLFNAQTKDGPCQIALPLREEARISPIWTVLLVALPRRS